MAVPSYTTDLSIFNDCTSTTNFIELDNYNSGSKESLDPDLAIYGTDCISASNRSVGLCSLGFTGTAMTLATNECVFIWQKFFAPNSLNTEASGGIIVGVGNAIGAYYKWTFDGSDSYPYGGWKNYAVDPTKTTGRTTFGSPSGVWSAVGAGWDMINGISQGNAFQIDIIRYGRGESIFTGGETASYATFDGYALVNDNATTGRFGLIQAIKGGYLWKGLMSLGTASTAVDFRDSNVIITVDNTKHVSSVFNKIEVNNASSNIEWTSINMSALGTQSKGDFEVIDNTTVNFDSCSFASMGTFTFQSNSTINTTTWRLCDQITQGGAVFSECNFIRSSNASAIISDDIELISNCSFTSVVINSPINTYYFNASDAAATDPNSVWSSDSLAFDGIESNYATGSFVGSTSSNFLLAEGTSAPLSGATISSVRPRVSNYLSNSGFGEHVEAAIYTDTLGEFLGTCLSTGGGYGNYGATLSTPSGGWTWTKVQALEVKLYKAGVVEDIITVGPGRVEIEVTSDAFEQGTGHAIEIPTGATGTYIFTGNLFDGYATQSGSTGNEMIYNNSGGLVTINVGSPGDTPTYRNGTGASTVVNNNVTVTLTGLKDNTEVRVYNAGTQSELAGIESATGGGGIDLREFAFSLGAALSVDIVIHNIDYQYLRIDGYTIPGSNSSVPIQQRFDRNYNNPVT